MGLATFLMDQLAMPRDSCFEYAKEQLAMLWAAVELLRSCL